MNIRQLRKLVNETVRAERNKTNKGSNPRRGRNWSRLVESTTRTVLNEEAKVADFRSQDIPLKLGDVDSDVAAKIADSGQGETDAIGVDDKAEWSCDQLKPSQTSMNLSKACWFALGMMNGTMYGSNGPGGELKCFVSSDDYLMDGHHRWIATVMVKPSAKVKGYKCNWPAKELIAVLNTLSVGALGVPEGKPGGGGFEKFTVEEEVVSRLQALYDGTHKNSDFGDGKKPGYGGTCAGATDDQEAAKKVMEKVTGKTGEEAVKEVAAMFIKNVTDCPTAKNPPSDFPDRKDMPVIDDDYVTEPGVSNATATAMKALTKGEMDITDTEGPKDGEYKNESINIRRWHKLAGLLKD